MDGKEYIDFLSMYSVTNFGHSHPKIVDAAIKAASKCAVVNMVSTNSFSVDDPAVGSCIWDPAHPHKPHQE